MRQRLTRILVLISLVGMPVGVALGSEQLGDLVGMPTLALLTVPGVAALALEQRRHQKA